jgi:hypothetical protein
MIQGSRRVSPSEKAAYHQVSGAGKSHVKREFFGLTEADADAIQKRLEAYIDEQFKRVT